MPKYYCDYCDVYLTHDSVSVRKAHNSGRNHLVNVRDYYADLRHDETQDFLDNITKAFERAGGPRPGMGGGPPPGYGAPRQFGGPPPFGMQGPPQQGFQQRGPPPGQFGSAPGAPMSMMGGPPPSFVPQGQAAPMQMPPQGQGFPPYNAGFGGPSSFPSGSLPGPGPGLPQMGGQMSPTATQFGSGPVLNAQPASSPPAPGSGPMINPQRAAALGLR